MSAPAAGTHPAGDTVVGALAGRYPYLTPGQCGLLETVLLSALASAAGRDCALAVIRPSRTAPSISASSSSAARRNRAAPRLSAPWRLPAAPAPRKRTPR